MGIIDLGLVWFLVWILKNAAVDVACAVKGQPNPRYEQRKARKEAAGGRYGLGDWWADLKADGLQAATEWRRRRADRKRQGKDREQVAVVEKPEPEVAQVRRPSPRPQPSVPADPADAPAEARPKPAPVIGSDEWWEGLEPAEPTPAPPLAAAQPNPPVPQPQPDTPAVPLPGPVPSPNVIPFTRKPIEYKENTVASQWERSVISEVIGLDQSIAYAKALAEHAREHGLAGNEAYVGHLTGQRVSGAALTTAHEMQEAFDNAASAAELHAAELEKQKGVQEQYDANPDAGDKDFQTQGR